MIVGVLNFADRQTDRQNDYSNPLITYAGARVNNNNNKVKFRQRVNPTLADEKNSVKSS